MFFTSPFIFFAAAAVCTQCLCKIHLFCVSFLPRSQYRNDFDCLCQSMIENPSLKIQYFTYDWHANDNTGDAAMAKVLTYCHGIKNNFASVLGL